MPGLRPPSPPRQSPFPIHDHHLPHTSGHRNVGLSSRPSAQPPTGQPVSKARGCGSLTAANGPRRVSTARRGRRPRCFPGTRGHWSMALPVSSRPSPRTAREPPSLLSGTSGESQSSFPRSNEDTDATSGRRARKHFAARATPSAGRGCVPGVAPSRSQTSRHVPERPVRPCRSASPPARCLPPLPHARTRAHTCMHTHI